MSTVMNSILAIDAGNTRVKWALFDATGAIVEHGVCLHADLQNTPLPKASRIIISNVTGKNMGVRLKSQLPANSKIHWITTQAEACGVINGYKQTATLGSDRWAALIGAWHVMQKTCIVVNAGTAVTIDALCIDPKNNQAIFKGGMIMPGLNLMQQSLGVATAQLPKILNSYATNETHHGNIFATNTVDAIYAGALHAILGAINMMAHHLMITSKLHPESNTVPSIVISGGNAAILHRHLIRDSLIADVTNSAIIVDNLVLQGLYLLENFMQSESQ